MSQVRTEGKNPYIQPKEGAATQVQLMAATQEHKP